MNFTTRRVHWTCKQARIQLLFLLGNHFHMRYLLFGWIGICALAMVAATRLRLGEPPGAPGLLELMVFSGTVFGYHFAHPQRGIRYLAWFFGGIALISFIFSSRTVQLSLLLPALTLGFYYGWGRPRRAGLRWAPFWKPPAVALAWAWVTVFIPVEARMNAGLWLVFATRFLFIYALALAYDLHDSAYDLRRGLETVANRLGASRTLRLIDVLLSVAAALELLRAGTGAARAHTTVALLVSLFCTRWAIRKLFGDSRNEAHRKALIDSMMVLQCLLLFVARCLS